MPPSGAVALGAFLAAYAVVENNFACCRWLAGRCFGLDLWRRKTTIECAETDYNRCALLKSAREMLSQGSASFTHVHRHHAWAPIVLSSAGEEIPRSCCLFVT